MADSDIAIHERQRTTSTKPESDTDAAERLESLGLQHSLRFQRLGLLTDLDMAMQYYQEAVDATTEDSPALGIRLQRLAQRYRDRYNKFGTMADLDKNIQLLERALQPAIQNHPDRPLWLERLGGAYHLKYRRTGAIEDLSIAIGRYHEALDSTAKPDVDLARSLESFGKVDLNRLEAIPDDLARRLECLGYGYQDRYRRTGNLTDFETSIKMFQEAVDATREGRAEIQGRLQGLGIAYHNRYQRTGAMEDLDIAIRRYREALDIAPPEEEPSSWRAADLENLGGAYRDRYRRTWSLADLELAISKHKEALDATPKDDPGLLKRLESLGVIYTERYLRTSAIADLDIAIKRFQEAFDATPKDNHIDLARQLESLGASHATRHERTGSVTELDKAIDLFQKALDMTPSEDGNLDFSRRLECLGAAYSLRFKNAGAISDIDLSIQRNLEAVKATSEGYLDLPRRLRVLGVAYEDRYSRLGEQPDLDKAISYYEKSVDILPEDHPSTARALECLGTGYRYRYWRTQVKVDFDMAIRAYQNAMEFPLSPVSDRFRAAVCSLRMHAEAESWPSAFSAACLGVALIPLLTMRSLENSDKQYLLTQAVGFASDAAAIALTTGETVYRAIELLELGRGIILGSSTEMRLDISDLEHKHPQIAEEFLQLRAQLDVSTAGTYQENALSASTMMEARSDARYHAGQKIEQLIKEIRHLPSFERFLLGPSEDEMKSAAAALGPIVAINVSKYRCDALIIQKNALRSVQLPNLSTSEIRIRAATLKADTIDADLLEWLWETIAKPVLQALGFIENPRDTYPRVWWIATGPLARFPIHAAGYHLGSTSTVLDRVISSYSSSIRSLVQSQQSQATSKDARECKRVALVGMPELPYALQEIKELKALSDGINLDTYQPQTSCSGVLAAINDCDIFHFAGHGHTDPLDPSRSALILSDKEPLSVSSLFETNLLRRRRRRRGDDRSRNQPFLAYLSACGTGQIKNDSLVDESLHLTAACQLAGFQHVIGTLWEVNDSSCVGIATDTYRWMIRSNMSSDSVSEGLHRACKRLRDEWVLENNITVREGKTRVVRRQRREEEPRSVVAQESVRESRDVVACDESPLHWVPYVHFGP